MKGVQDPFQKLASVNRCAPKRLKFPEVNSFSPHIHIIFTIQNNSKRHVRIPFCIWADSSVYDISSTVRPPRFQARQGCGGQHPNTLYNTRLPMRKTLYLKLILAYIIFGLFGFVVVATFVANMTLDHLKKEHSESL